MKSVILLCCLTIGLGACGDQAPPALSSKIELTPRITNEKEIVARVNGVPILKTDLIQQMAEGQQATTALETLIQLELLAQEASRRAMAQRPEIHRIQRRAMAGLLIRQQFVDRYTKDDIPEEWIKTAYQKNIGKFVHPELVRVTHILALANRNHTADFHLKAKKIADEIAKIATSRPQTVASFKEIAKQMAQQYPTVTIRAETLTTPQRGYTVEAFADAAFQLDRPGQISPVVPTNFGYHVIYLEEKIPAINISLDQARATVQEKIIDEARGQSFQIWLKKLEKKSAVTIDSQQLQQRLGAAQSAGSS